MPQWGLRGILSHTERGALSLFHSLTIMARTKKNRMSKKSRLPREVALAPTPYKNNPTLNRKFRFTNNNNAGAVSGFQVIIARQDLFTISGVSNSGGTPAFVSTFSAIRINRVQIWSNIRTSVDSFSQATLTWVSERGKQETITDNGTVNHPAYVSSRPPPDSLAGFWSQYNDADMTQTMFEIAAVGVAVVDVDVAYCPNYPGRDFTQPTGGSGAVFNALDNSGSKVLLPVD